MEQKFKFIGFWKRILITVIDIIIFYFYSVIIFFIDQNVLNLEPYSDLEFIFIFLMIVLLPTITLFLLWKFKGASVGKFIFNVRIVDAKTYSHPTDKQLLYRLLGNFLSNFSFLLSYIHIGIDSRKQAWHDKFSNTVLVKNAKMEYLRTIDISFSNKRDKTFLRIETVFFIVFILVTVVFIFFTFYDEPIKPEAEEWFFENNLVEEEPEKNGFYYLVGFDCLEGDDPFQIGYNWVQIQNKKATNEYEEVVIVNDLNWSDEEKAKYEEKNKKRYENDYFENLDLGIISEKLNLFDQDDIFSYLVKNRTLIDSLKTSYNFLNVRYHDLISFSYFSNTLIPHYKVYTPIFMGIINMKRLNLAWIGKEYKLGNKQDAITELSNEIELSRFLLTNTHSIMGKIVATVLFELDLHLLSDLIDETEADELNRLLPTNLTPSEKNWREVAMSNFNQSIGIHLMYNDPSFIKTVSNGKISEFLFKIKVKKRFKLNKLINETYNAQNFMYHLSQLNAKEFMDQKDNYPETEFNLDFKISFWDQLFNPAGAILNVSAVPIGRHYIAQFHDIDGFINMLKLKVMIKSNHYKSQDIQAFVEAQSDLLYNPYTEEAFEWDAEKSILHFDGPYQDDNNLRKVKINR